MLCEHPHELALDKVNPLQKAVQVLASALPSVLNCALQVIDRGQQILDEILMAVLIRLLALLERSAAKVLEVGLKAYKAVVPLLELRTEGLHLGRRVVA